MSGTANPSLVDPLNEAFPLIDQGEESEPSLQDLVLGTDHDKAEEVGIQKRVSHCQLLQCHYCLSLIDAKFSLCQI